MKRQNNGMRKCIKIQAHFNKKTKNKREFYTN